MNQTAEVCEADSGRELFTLKPQDGNGILSLAFSPDGKRIVTGSYGRTAKVWDALMAARSCSPSRGTPIRLALWLFRVGRQTDCHRQQGSNGQAVGRSWRAANCSLSRGTTVRFRVWPFPRTAGGFLTGSADKTAKLWDATTGRELLTFKGHNADCSFVAFSPNGQWIVTGQRGNAEKVWTAAHPEQVALWQSEDTAPGATLVYGINTMTYLCCVLE